MLRTRLARPGRTLRLLDIEPPASRRPGEEVVVASVTDMAAMTKACAGRGRGDPPGRGGRRGARGSSILEVNIQGTYTVFEAARRAGVPRVIFASSNHAVGFTPRSAFPVPDYAFPAPDTYYGVSKVTGEALAAQYHHRYRHGHHLPAHPVLLRAAAERARCCPPGCPRTTPGGCSRPA